MESGFPNTPTLSRSTTPILKKVVRRCIKQPEARKAGVLIDLEHRDDPVRVVEVRSLSPPPPFIFQWRIRDATL